MSQQFAKCPCSVCGRKIEFPIEGAGMSIDCPACGKPTVLFAEGTDSTHVSPEEIEAGLVNYFEGPIRKVEASFMYQVGLALVAVMMLLLPVLYVGMIGCAGWGVYWFGDHFRGILPSMTGGLRFYLLKLVFYYGTLFAGGVVVLFMLKPLFARRVKCAEPLALNPEVERGLYAFIAKISEVTGAPMPKRIDLDCQLNASAGFRRGLLSFFGNDMVLTIGLPLVAGLNTQELAGVIAHEFGHFTQAAAMRLSYIIDSINRWFVRVVFERDAWDVWLVSMAEEAEDAWVTLIIFAAQTGIGTSRLILRGLMLIGAAVSCFLVRQMEYSADEYWMQLVGSQTLESTTIRLHIFGAAAKTAYKDMRVGWNNSHKLPDDFSACLLESERRLPPETKKRIEDRIGFGTTGLFDTHPSVADRVRRARQANEPGVFHLQIPARKLFAAFEVVSKQVTMLHYSDDLGIPLESSMLEPVKARANP